MTVINILNPEIDIPNSLRELAEMIELGELDKADHLTMVYGTNVYHFGTPRKIDCATNAIWDLELGKHILFTAAIGNNHVP